jgi:prolyl-tRNA editing enzyme YbaK/EbsC (Cys-tRNA(Pro) deacylase)
MKSDLEQKVIEALRDFGVPYEIISIDSEFSDTAAFCEKYGYPLEQTCNTIIVTSRKRPKKYAACVVLANTRLDVNQRVKKLLGVSKSSFAAPDETRELTGMQMGGVTPFSLPADWALFVDERIMTTDWVILGGGGRGTKIKVGPEVFQKLGAQVVSDLAIET